MRAAGLLAAMLLVAGCNSGGSYFPDEPGMVWTYSVRTGHGAQHVEQVRVARRTTVAGTEGFALAGPLGTSRLAWKRGALWAEELPGARLLPPLPLFRNDLEPASWEGMIESPMGKGKARATLIHAEEKLKIGGRTFAAVRAELKIERRAATTVLTSWLAPGVGILRQEQRTDGALELRMEWVAGPARPEQP
jgi:hypothetical protein